MKKILFFGLLISFSIVNAQGLERVVFSAAASSDNNFQPVMGTPYGASLSGSGGSLEISAEYGEGTYGQSSLSLNENVHQSNIRIYPNPTKDKLIIDLSLSKETSTMLVLVDINGKVLQQHQYSNTIEEMDLTNYSTGTYLLHISANDQHLQTFRIQKTK